MPKHIPDLITALEGASDPKADPNLRRGTINDAIRKLDQLQKVLEPFDNMCGELYARNYDADEKVLSFRTPEGESVVLDFADFLCVRDAIGNHN